jgi:peptidoglycan/LPS O-acetylase OafA/YrhL
MPRTSAQNAHASPDPVVLSYTALRRAVGIVAFVLPFAVTIPVGIATHHVEASISASYYTFMRNFFVGSLCAISMFMLCCRGYDRKDVIASEFSALCALGVAFFPCQNKQTATVHYTSAALLFSTLAFFCLYLFRLSSGNPTQRKLQRNRVYAACGVGILVSMAAMALIGLLEHFAVLSHPPAHSTLLFETSSLICFGIAWLVKGEALLQDRPGEKRRPQSRTTSRLLSLDPDPDPPRNASGRS